MNIIPFLILGTNLLVISVKATIQRDVVTYINVFRHMHASGPLIVDDVLQKAAENVANTYMKANNKDKVPIYQYSANFCKYTGPESTLDRTCVISWYVTMKYFSWCYPKAEGQALPFVNMIWKASTKVGVGIAKASDGTYFVVVYILLLDANNVRGNVPPVKVVMEASDKADCPTGYYRFKTSCFKYVPTAVTWDEALVQCARENATLASIRNSDEEKFVRDLQRKAGSTVDTWIGLSDNLREGRFKFFDGLRFKPGVCVPINANGGMQENCVAWSIEKPEGCWEDRPCSEKIPYTCRTPVEGKSTYRTEILFKKFRWNPSYKDKNSKAYRDLLNGIRITFKEIFTRQSGQAKGGFRNATVKGVRAVSFQGRPNGLGISIKVQFRSFNADPTLRFQKFLRGSEKILSMDIDKPDKVQGKTGKAGDYCYSSCNHKHTCAATLYQQSPSYSHYPGYPAPVPQPYSPNLYPVPYSATVSSTPTITDPYPSTCPLYCSQHSVMDCYMQCNDECCDHRNGKRKSKPDHLNSVKNANKRKRKPSRFQEEHRRPNEISDFHDRVRKKDGDVSDSIPTNLEKPGILNEHFDVSHNRNNGSRHWTFDQENKTGYDQKYRKSLGDTTSTRRKATSQTNLEKESNPREHFTMNLNKTENFHQPAFDADDMINYVLKHRKFSEPSTLQQNKDVKSAEAMTDNSKKILQSKEQVTKESLLDKLNTTSAENNNEDFTFIFNKTAQDSSMFDKINNDVNALEMIKAHEAIDDISERKKSNQTFFNPLRGGFSAMTNPVIQHKHLQNFNERNEDIYKHSSTMKNNTQDSKVSSLDKADNNENIMNSDDLIDDLPEPKKPDHPSFKHLNDDSSNKMGLIKEHKHVDKLYKNATADSNDYMTTILNKIQGSKLSSLDDEESNRYAHENIHPDYLINDLPETKRSNSSFQLSPLQERNQNETFDEWSTEASNEHLSTSLNNSEDSTITSFDKEDDDYDNEKGNTKELIDDADQELKNSDTSSSHLLNGHSSSIRNESDQEPEEIEKQSVKNLLEPTGNQIENDTLDYGEESNLEKQELNGQEEDEMEKEDNMEDESNSVLEPMGENLEPGDDVREPNDDDSEPGGDDYSKEDDSNYADSNKDEDEDEKEHDFYLDDSRKEPSEEHLDDEGIEDAGIFGRRKRNKIFKREW